MAFCVYIYTHTEIYIYIYIHTYIYIYISLCGNRQALTIHQGQGGAEAFGFKLEVSSGFTVGWTASGV